MGKHNHKRKRSRSKEPDVSSRELWKRLQKLERKIARTSPRKKRRSRSYSTSPDSGGRRLNGAASRSGTPSPRRSRSRGALGLESGTESRAHSRSRSRSRLGGRDNLESLRVRSPTASLSIVGRRDLYDTGPPSYIGDSASVSRSLYEADTGNTKNKSPNNIEYRENARVDLPESYEKILGSDPNLKIDNHFELHQALVSRWNHLMVHGLPTSEINNLLSTHVTPTNISLIAPKMNPELNFCIWGS